MIAPDDILLLIKSKINIAIPYINKNGKNDGLVHPKPNKPERGCSQRDSDLQELPEYYEGYNEKVQEYESILVHSERAIFPEKLFSDPVPNQTEEEFEYYKNNYKNTTRPIFMDYVSVTSRPFHKSNWSIDYNEDEKFKEYAEEMPVHGSLENFMKFVLPAIKAKDAEGVIATKPFRIPTTVNEEGQTIIKENELTDPIPVYYTVKQLLSYDFDHALIELTEKSIVTEGNRKMRAGFVFEFYDDVKIYKIIQVGKRIDYNFEIAAEFEHNCDKLPVHKLKGVPVYNEDSILWQSPFLYAVPNLDLVLINQNNLQAVINKCVYPYRIMIGDVCEFEDSEGNQCHGGIVTCQTDQGRQDKVCTECNGAGIKSRVSKIGELLFAAPQRDDNTEASISQPLMQYVAPSTETPQFIRTEIKENENRAQKILHINTTNQVAQPQSDITATSKAIDLKSQAAFISTVSGQEFWMYKEILNDVGCMRFGKDGFEKPTLTEPITFDFSTEEDYVSRLKEALDANAPPIVIRQIIIQFLETIYFNEEKQAKVLRLITQTDSLLGLKGDSIRLNIANGTAQKWQSVLHDSPTTLIDELVQEDENFFEQEFKVQQEQLIEKAQSKVEETEEIEQIIGT